MRRIVTAGIATVLAIAGVVAAAPGGPGDRGGAPPSIESCADDKALYGNAVTVPEVFAPGFPQRRILTAEIVDYVDVVGSQSDRVTVGTAATSWGGTDLVYALVTSPENHLRMDQIVEANRILREPRLIGEKGARRLAADTPAIVWYQGNVHGTETSGADAAVSLLHDLADRVDCTVEAMLEHLVIGILPTQNPDGRDVASRQNLYGFDMNRDWFAGTQPETRGKLALLADYPPVLFVDAHEMGDSSFFFPPNADPIHHEVADQALGWIDELYAPAMRAAFDDRRVDAPTEWTWFNHDTYDLFYLGYGDSMPTTAYGAAGMTFEKGTADLDGQKHDEQYVAGWTTLVTAAQHRERILFELWGSYDQAIKHGRAGVLEANLVVEPANEVVHEVPAQTLRNYFLLESNGSSEVRRLVARLRSTGVEVHRVEEDLVVIGRRPGVEAAPTAVPAGSWWVPMAQPQKRWIQALLGEDPYVPFDYFYDVSSWSNPQLMNVDVLATAEAVRPVATKVARQPGLEVVGDVAEATSLWFPGNSGQDVALAVAAAEAGAEVHRLTLPNVVEGTSVAPGAFVVTGALDKAVTAWRADLAHLSTLVQASQEPLPGDARPFFAPKIAVFEPATSPVTLISEPWGHLAWTLEQHWKLPFDALTSSQIAAGQLSTGAYDVLLVGGVATTELDPSAPMVEDFIANGGTYVGLARGATGGTSWAVANGWTTSTLQAPTGTAGGTTFRIEVDPAASAATLGASAGAYWFNLPDHVLSPTRTGATVARYPAAADLWFSGYAAGEQAWAQSAVLVQEAMGDGTVLLFSGDPAFRGLTEGPAFLLANALVSPATPQVGVLRDVDTDPRGVAAARASVTVQAGWQDLGWGRSLVIEVDPSDAPAATAVLRRFDPAVRIDTPRPGTTRFTFANPDGLDVEAHPFSRHLLAALRDAGIAPRVAFL